LNEFPALWLRHHDLQGVNVTVPHKEKVLQYLDRQDSSAIKVGAANVVNKEKGKLVGYNTDYMAFKQSLRKWIGKFNGEALILGSGGAAKAIQAGLTDLGIPHNQVSRDSNKGEYTYEQLKNYPDIITRFRLIVNTTPLGMHPDVDTFPDIPYSEITKECFAYDLVYNPAETVFLKKIRSKGAKTKNGLEMLKLQAEKSWDIWTK
ncbi:MAG: shikimate dehydrogenase, partial [Bacteroidota bacterium]